MPKFWLWQSSKYGRVFNMRALLSVLNMPEYALIELWIYLALILNMAGSEYARVTQSSKHATVWPQYG